MPNDLDSYYLRCLKLKRRDRGDGAVEETQESRRVNEICCSDALAGQDVNKRKG